MENIMKIEIFNIFSLSSFQLFEAFLSILFSIFRKEMLILNDTSRKGLELTASI